MLRFFHFADLHFGRVFHGTSLLEDQAHLVEQILTLVRSDKPDAVILAGDLFDRSVPPVGAVRLLDYFLKGLSEAGTTVIAIPGNHDSADRLAYGATAWESLNVHFRTDYSRLDEPVTVMGAEGGFDVFAIPFVERAALREALENEGSNTDEPATGTSDLPTDKTALMALATEKMRLAMNTERPAVLVAHEFVTGSTESGSERLYVGGSPSVPFDVFDGFEFVALGHIHGSQAAGGDHIRYSGSPMSYDFSEAGSQRGFLDIHLDPSALYPEISFRDLKPLRPLSVLEDSLDELLHNTKYQRYKQHYVSARITDGLSHLNLIGRIRERFPYYREIRQTALEAGPREEGQTRAERETPETVFSDFLDRAGWDEGDERSLAAEFFAEALDATAAAGGTE